MFQSQAGSRSIGDGGVLVCDLDQSHGLNPRRKASHLATLYTQSTNTIRFKFQSQAGSRSIGDEFISIYGMAFTTVSIPGGKPLHWRPRPMPRSAIRRGSFNPRREAAPLATRIE